MSTDETTNHRVVEVAAATSFALARLRLGPLNHYQENGEGFYCNSPDFPREEHTEGLLIRLGRFLAILGKLVCLAMLSAVSYGIFYQNAMPAQHVIKELHFDYTSSSPGYPTAYPTANGVAPKRYPRTWPSDYGSPTSTTPDMHRAVPTATLDLLAKHNEWHAYFEDVLPQPSTKLRRVLEAKQAYFIEVALTLPESQSNKYSGMFGVVTELYTSGNHDETSMGNNGTCRTGGNRELTLLAVSTRSYRFPHQSSWISVLGKVIILVPLLVGAFEEVKTVASPAFRHFIESSARPLHFVKVKILQRPDATPVEAIGGFLRIGEEYSVFQETLRTWFFTCAYFGTLFFCIFYYVSFLLLRCAWAAFQDYRQRRMGSAESTFDFDGTLDDGFDASLFEDCRDDADPTTNHQDDMDQEARDVTMETMHGSPGVGATSAPITDVDASETFQENGFAMDPSDDDWEDMQMDDFAHSVGVMDTSVQTTPNSNLEQHMRVPRTITDAELNALMFMRPHEDSGTQVPGAPSDAASTADLGNSTGGKETNARQRHPFFFFFCW